jgi:DNA-binding NarL/FixJ family response regulator
MKLLIVEDNPIMRRLIRRIVSDATDEITECTDGSEAVDAYAELHPDCVLMDVEMKQTNGILATRQIKALFPEARIVIVTQYDDHALRRAAEEAGAAGYMLKENLHELRQWLKAKT